MAFAIEFNRGEWTKPDFVEFSFRPFWISWSSLRVKLDGSHSLRRLVREKPMDTLNKDCSKILKAMAFAEKAHRGQMRKGTTVPYITHPYAVALLLAHNGESESLIIGGLLHDCLEDTDVTEAQIREIFGNAVADIVIGCSEEDRDGSWKSRKTSTLERLRHASLDVCKVATADKLHNLSCIVRDYEKYGEKLWERFNADRDSVIWYYLSLTESLWREKGENTLHHQYRQLVTDFKIQLISKEGALVMTKSDSSCGDFGCSECRKTPAPDEPLAFNRVRSLFRSSHWNLSICRCPSCAQPYLSEFKEIIDWVNGNDDMWSRWLPLTLEELAEINNRLPEETNDQGDLQFLFRLLPLRPRLVKGPDGRFAWHEPGYDAVDLMPPG